MASSFKNAHAAIATANTDQDLYTANSPNQVSAVVHGLYFANTGASANVNVYLKIYDDSATATRVVLNEVPVPPNTSLSMDKPLNLEPSDKIVIRGSNTDCEVFASILELST